MEKCEESFIEFNFIRNSVSFEKPNLFNLYLKDVFEDLSKREEKETKDKSTTVKGISKIMFSYYMKVPVFISEKLFLSFDKDCDGLLNEKEFTGGMSKLYLGNFQETAKVIFNIYDYDKDDIINKGDVKVLLSYLPLKSDESVNELGYKKQMKSLEELDDILNLTFGSKGGSTLDFEKFLENIQEKKSDIYIHLLCFLYQNKPFEVETINNYKNHKTKSILGTSPFKKNQTLRIIAPQNDFNPKLPSPCKMSNFSSTEKYVNQVKLRKSRMQSPEQSKKNKIDTIVTHRAEKSMSPQKTQSKFFNSTITSSKSSTNQPSPTIKNPNQNGHNRKTSDLTGKEMIRFTNQKIVKEDSKGEDLSIINLLETSKNVFDSPTVFFNNKAKNPPQVSELNLEENLVNLNLKNQDENLFYEEKAVHYEDWIFKTDEPSSSSTEPKKRSITSTNLNKYYMVLRGKEISLYFSNQLDELVIFHNLSNCFVKEGETITKDKVKYYSFCIIYSKSLTRYYYTNSEQTRTKWVENIKKAIGYQNFMEFYDLVSDIDEGRFGKVKLGVHKSTGEKVAIKIIKKSDLLEKEMELVRNELDVTKLFRHPNIVRLLDHFENDCYIFMVMEYLSGGHLRSYLERNENNLTEKQAARIIYSIAHGIKYMNSFGIIHRDLKTENIMLTDESEKAGIKIIDFGLTKTLAPDEKLAEGMGTITFVAPEVITRKPYNKQVDVWSLGVLLYLLLTGTLPFDDSSGLEEDIAKKVVFQDLSFTGPKFKNRSEAAVNLLDQCLVKNPDKRITIEQVLKNDWLIANFK